MTRTPKRFQDKTLALFDKLNAIMDELDGERVTVRYLFYRLVALHWIENSRGSYSTFCKHLVNARAVGIVDPDRIVDDLRFLMRVATWQGLADYWQAVRVSYRREKWDTQPHHVEVWCEKNAVASILRPVCDEYEVGLFPCRGYDSFTELRQAAGRFRDLGKPHVVFYLGDFDPTGQDIPRDIRDRAAELFGVDLDLRVIALNAEQVARYSLPPAMTKPADSRRARFVAEHGDRAVELDALDPRVLRALVRDHIEQYFDMAHFEAEQATEAEERAELVEVLRAV